MNSTFAWLDYSEHERRKFDEILTGLNENDTQDKLGLGSVRGAFVEILCPRISTFQTRAPCFLFVPWASRRIEQREERPSVTGAQPRDCLDPSTAAIRRDGCEPSGFERAGERGAVQRARQSAN